MEAPGRRRLRLQKNDAADAEAICEALQSRHFISASGSLRKSQADTTELIGLIIEVHEIIIRRPKGSPEAGSLRFPLFLPLFRPPPYTFHPSPRPSNVIAAEADIGGRRLAMDDAAEFLALGSST